MTDRSLDIVIVDSDELYLKRLAGAIGACRGKNHIVRAFSQKQKAIELLKVNQPDALVIERDLYCDEFKNLFEGKTIVITEDESGEGDELCRYKSAQSIIGAIGEPFKKKSKKTSSGEVLITGVMSFCEAEYKNAYALALSANEAKTKKVLYINLDEFSALRTKLKGGSGYTISDAIYAYRQGAIQSDFIKKAIGTTGGFDYMVPTLCADDLAGLKAKEINRFICDISQHYGYNRVILDVGYALGEPWEVFKFCDSADMPYKEGIQGRMSEFVSYMHQSGKAFILDMIRQIKIPPELMPYNEERWFEGESEKWIRWLETDRSIL